MLRESVFTFGKQDLTGREEKGDPGNKKSELRWSLSGGVKVPGEGKRRELGRHLGMDPILRRRQRSQGREKKG